MSDTQNLDTFFDDENSPAKTAVRPAILTVEALNKQIRGLIEGQFQQVWVQAEISNFKAHTSGHFYFSLKDTKSQISAVMFRGNNSQLKFRPADGLEVIVRGKVTVYEPRGNYQIAVESMEPVGAGALQKAFEQLKSKLRSEGLFDPKRKRPIPKIPRHVAIITSPTGAAIQDMMNVLRRRNPLVRITLVPTIVQGEAAAPKICASLETAWKLPDVDVIIVGRGGGSIEDMWCFNDERVARVVAKSPIPVISAVGHEIDFTICDFVADLRAPTPSAAAELVTTSREELLGNLAALQRLMATTFGRRLHSFENRLALSAKRLVDPKRRLQDLMQRNDELQQRMHRAWLNSVKHLRSRIGTLNARLPSPQKTVDRNAQNLKLLSVRLAQAITRALEKRRAKYTETVALLSSLSPLKTVERGYSIVQKQGTLISSITDVKPGDTLNINVKDGTIVVDVKFSSPEEPENLDFFEVNERKNP